MIRTALALGLLAAPALADRPPEAFPERYLVAVVCDATACAERYVAIYDSGPMACTMSAMPILATISLRPGETIEGWRCER
jgi:hypothetical protein